MQLYPFNVTPVRKRIAEPIDHRWEITAYDNDNKYPQRAEEVAKESPLVVSSTDNIQKVLVGKGFENKEAAKEPANSKGHTWNDLHRWVAGDMSLFKKSFSLLHNFNGLGEIIETEYVPFKYVRLSKPDMMGNHTSVKVSNNWEEDPRKLPQGTKITPIEVPLYNPMVSPFSFTTEVQEDGTTVDVLIGDGQLRYVTPMPNCYPPATFDAVFDSAQADGEIQAFELSSIQFGFLGAMLMKIPQGSMSDDDKAKLQRMMEEMMGSQGGRFFGLEWPEGENFGSSVLEALPANNNDALFVQTFQNIINRILIALKMPGPLVGVNPQGGIFNEAQYRDGFKYLNLMYEPERNIIEQVFNEINPELGKIEPLEFTNQSPNTEGQNQFTGTPEEEPTEEDAPQD